MFTKAINKQTNYNFVPLYVENQFPSTCSVVVIDEPYHNRIDEIVIEARYLHTLYQLLLFHMLYYTMLKGVYKIVSYYLLYMMLLSDTVECIFFNFRSIAEISLSIPSAIFVINSDLENQNINTSSSDHYTPAIVRFFFSFLGHLTIK